MANIDTPLLNFAQGRFWAQKLLLRWRPNVATFVISHDLLNRNELQMSNARHDQVTLLDEFQMTYVEVELVSRVS